MLRSSKAFFIILCLGFLMILMLLVIYPSMHRKMKAVTNSIISREEHQTEGPKDEMFQPFGVYGKANEKLVIYNRLSKSGSTTILTLLNRLKTGVKLMHSNLFGKKYNLLDRDALQKFIKSFQNLTAGKVLFERHVYFVDFERFGYKQPIYFNIIRDPFERTLSYYHYQFTRLEVKSRMRERIEFYKTHKENETFEECINLHLNSSSLDVKCLLFPPDWYIRWFCGHEDECTNEEYGLAKAKENIDKYYMLIGLTEEYTKTVKALEVLLPSYFKGIDQLYANSPRHNITPSRKKRPSEEIIKFIKNRYKLSYEIYNYVKQKFYLAISSLGID